MQDWSFSSSVSVYESFSEYVFVIQCVFMYEYLSGFECEYVEMLMEVCKCMYEVC